MTPASEKASHKPLIVAIDDDVFQLSVYRIILSYAYDVRCFSAISPESLASAMQAQHVILDLRMEPRDGIEFITQWAGMGDGVIPKNLVICSGMNEEVRSLCAGVARLQGIGSVISVGKPVSRRELIAALKQASDPDSAGLHQAAAIDYQLSEDALRMAITDEAIEPYWQPQISVASGCVSGMEVLARWPRTGTYDIPPQEFINGMELSNISGLFFRYMLRQSLASFARWQGPAAYDGFISVNLPPRVLDEPGLSREVLELLAEHSISPRRLVLEVTESEAHQQESHYNINVARLLMAGIQFAIDDFGMGYSNVARLSSGIFAELKIDGQLVREYQRSETVRNVVNSVVLGARQSKLRVVAEGVSDNTTRDCMVQLGCTDLQGYLYAKPMKESDLVAWLLNYQPAGFEGISQLD
jgi:EAL domain-containing protein (putative c-di-GMP-specific phosphodiesterase class I)/CheY-like chemotaxis protein